MSVTAINPTAAAAVSMAGAGKPQALRNLPEAEQIKAAAGQFEAIILRQLLQESMGKLAGDGGPGNVYGFMLTDVLANKLSEGGGLGLGSILEQQLAPRTAKASLLANAKETP